MRNYSQKRFTDNAARDLYDQVRYRLKTSDLPPFYYDKVHCL